MTSPASTPAAAPVAPPTPAPQGRARLLSYAQWQLRDYFIAKGIGTVLIVALFLFIAYLPLLMMRPAVPSPEALRSLAETALAQILTNFVLFGVLFATNGIVAEDRKFGYYRFYFSKPVGVVAFYVQKFLVHIAGLLMIAAVMLEAFAQLIYPIYPSAYFQVLVLLFVGLGGIGFMLSSVTTADWVSLIGVYVISLLAWSLYGVDEGWRGAATRLLPPVHELPTIYQAMITGDAVPMKWVWWIAGYGAVCATLGLAVLTRRRLATN